MHHFTLPVNTTAHSPVKRKMRDPLEFLAQKRQITQSQYCADCACNLPSRWWAVEGCNHPTWLGTSLTAAASLRARRPAASGVWRSVVGTLKLSPADFELVRQVLADGLFLTEVALHRGLTAERAQRKLNKRFKECLDILSSAFAAPNTMAA